MSSKKYLSSLFGIAAVALAVLSLPAGAQTASGYGSDRSSVTDPTGRQSNTGSSNDANSTTRTGKQQSSGTSGDSSGAGIGGATTDSKGATSGTSPATSDEKSAASGEPTVNKKDRKFIRDLAYANLSEIEAAKLAQTKSKDESVLSFAKRMIDDHTKAQNLVQQLAKSKGVELPTEPDAVHKATVKMLSVLSGETFDRRYMARAGEADHKKTIDLLKKIGTEAKDSDLKTLSAELLPTIEAHLSMIPKK